MRLPEYNDRMRKGVTGEDWFRFFVTNELGHIYQSSGERGDFGVDGFIDIVSGTGVTGIRAAVQIKHGNSYFSSKRHTDTNSFWMISTLIIILTAIYRYISSCSTTITKGRFLRNSI